MEQEQRLVYESRLKQIMDEEAAQREAELRVQHAEQKAEQKAKEAEHKTKETIALRLLEKGLEIEFVANATGLTKNIVIDIQRGMQK
ncbi:hypothetical protein [Lentibacillus sp. Marseille-P4043]|uniref:hypothetical protein n=1 Tax=Lentibacillus sp. Marseille-P4043 TaxID=2040293 RepID=UPI001F2965C5|nr:hypothetical protein [Lentibacillus sp. Marseille-P4043]